jgi:hypothetical protein
LGGLFIEPAGVVERVGLFSRWEMTTDALLEPKKRAIDEVASPAAKCYDDLERIEALPVRQ